jgi:hypothetical protein
MFARKRQESRRRLVDAAENSRDKFLRVGDLFAKAVLNNSSVKIPDLFTHKHYNYKNATCLS